jgi:hypothetical protein
MKTKHKLMTGLAFSAAFLTAIAAMPTARAEMNANGAEVVTTGPQANPQDSSGSWSARQNVRDSQRYDAVVHSNSRYRASRVKKECGPINDPQLHASCVASFSEGSSTHNRSSRQ